MTNTLSRMKTHCRRATNAFNELTKNYDYFPIHAEYSKITLKIPKQR